MSYEASRCEVCDALIWPHDSHECDHADVVNVKERRAERRLQELESRVEDLEERLRNMTKESP